MVGCGFGNECVEVSDVLFWSSLRYFCCVMCRGLVFPMR